MQRVPKSPSQTASNRPSKAGALYRGVRLQEAGGTSRFTADQVKRAVTDALEKHADALADRPKA